MSYLFLEDGLPILKTQFGLHPDEIAKWRFEDVETVVEATNDHVLDGEHDSRDALASIIKEVRKKYSVPDNF